MPQTANWALPYPSLSDPPNVPLDIQRLAVAAESAFGQNTALYPGTQSEDIALTTGVQTIVNWTFNLPTNWQAANVLFHWSARQYTPAGEHIRTIFIVNIDGGQAGPSIIQSGYVAGGSFQYANMIDATRLFMSMTPGTHRVTITAQIEVGDTGHASLGGQVYFATLSRTK